MGAGDEPGEIPGAPHVPEHPTQLDELIDTYAREKHCLAAAELDLQELNDTRTALEERIAHAERAMRDCVIRVDASYQAVRRRIDAQTDSPLHTELVNDRCAKLLTIKSK